MTPEISYSDIGIPHEVQTPDFTSSPHGKLAEMVRAKIAKSARIFSPSHTEKPVDYREKTISEVSNLQSEMQRLFYTYHMPNTPKIFSSQKEYEDFANGGIMALSNEQVQTTIKIIEAEQKANEIQKLLSDFVQNKVKEAQEKEDLSSYLMWSVEEQQKNNYYSDNKKATWYTLACEEEPESQEEYTQRIEAKKSQFDAEAKLVRRMQQDLTKLPDKDKIKISIMRLPAESDKSRPPRSLMHTPQNSFSRWHNDLDQINQDERLIWTFTEAPCVNHALDDLYKLTRETVIRDQFKPRAFYVTSQSVEKDSDDQTKVPARFLEISFADGSEPIPPFRNNFRNLKFFQNPALLKKDIDQNSQGSDGQMHYILGYDENGARITQDTLPYAMESLTGSFSNVYTIRVGQFFKP